MPLLVDKKGLSEAAFIRVLYDCLLSEDDTMEDKERLARWCLGLHKEYWLIYSNLLAEKEAANKVLLQSYC